mmetsp:Transcript_23985/g.39045  ORF Transcript_23985/g.39045 Transcript_23985/m.39045 type:complete len:843 (-) Transcript_23985:88-2616(-)
MAGNKDEGKPTNGEESARGSRKAGRRRKKRANVDGPTTDIVVNGVFLKSIRPEDTKALLPAEWEAVRDYVLSERKKLIEKNGPASTVDVAGDSDKGIDNEATKKSPPENLSNVAQLKVNSGGPTNVTINGVFLKSIWPDDTKALSPADWELVRDYVMHERKKLAEKNAPNDSRNVIDPPSTKTVSAKTAPVAGNSEVQSPPENTSAIGTDAKKANKNARSKKKNGRNGGKDANSMEPVEDSVVPVFDEQQNSSSNSRRAKAKGKSNTSPNASNASSQNGVSTKQKAQLGGKSKKVATEVDHAQLLAANEKAKLEHDRADGLAKQVTFLGQELKRVTKELEKSKSEAKRHQKDLSTVNASLCLEQSVVAKLKSQLVLEMAAKESCAKELERIKEVVASERKKFEDLQEELSHTKTARDSMAQELNDNKLRAERVKKLEIELREERAKIARLGNPSSKATMTLRKELHDTQEKLKKAKKRNEVLTSELSAKNYPQRQQQTGYISQRETKGPNGEPTGKSLKIASPKRTTSMPAPVEVSLSERASLVNFESAPVHYDGIDDDNDDDGQSSGPVQDELAFIRSAFSSHEISVDDKQVIYTRQLPVDDDSGDVMIDISVTLPARYPSVGVDEIKVAMNETSTCSPEIRKIALDALPTLQEICLIEARAREGSAGLLSIFSVADMWAKDDWHGVMAKQLSLLKGKGKKISSKNSGGKGSFEICTFLIYTHHIVDPDKIQLVKKSASKLNLGGYIKIGKPGLILVEGSQPDCEALLETLLLSRKKLRERGGKNFDTATFSPAGKMQRYDNERELPKKLEQLEAQDGMDEIKDACRKLGLLESLDEVCKR